jgi:hypothetical protein
MRGLTNMAPVSPKENEADRGPADSKPHSEIDSAHCCGQISNEADILHGEFRIKIALATHASRAPFACSVTVVVDGCTKEKVLGIHARRIVTTVKHPHARWDSAECQLPTKPVCAMLPTGLAVTILVSTPSPEPTVTGLVHFCPEARAIELVDTRSRTKAPAAVSQLTGRHPKLCFASLANAPYLRRAHGTHPPVGHVPGRVAATRAHSLYSTEGTCSEF